MYPSFARAIATGWLAKEEQVNNLGEEIYIKKILIEFKISISKLALSRSWGLITKSKYILN